MSDLLRVTLGFRARSAGNAAYPKLWDALVGVWCPRLQPASPSSPLIDLSGWTDVQGPVTGATWENEGLVFNGTSDEVDFDAPGPWDMSAARQTGLTLFARFWNKQMTIGAGEEYRGIFGGQNHINNQGYASSGLFMTTGTVGTLITAQQWDGGQYRDAVSSVGDLNSIGWHTAACVIDPARAGIFVYINGVEYGSASPNFGGTWLAPTEFFMGARYFSSSGQFYDDKISIGAVWQRALAESELRLLADDYLALFRRRPTTVSITAAPVGATPKGVFDNPFAGPFGGPI